MPSRKPEIPLRRAGAILAFAIGVILILATLLPGIIYFVGLFNIDGRPAFAQTCQLNSAQKLALWKELGESAKHANDISVRAMNPWAFAAKFHFKTMSKRNAGERAAWFVARNHNIKHLGNRRMTWWHISGAALTIWLTRHWTAEELICKANEISSQKVKR